MERDSSCKSLNQLTWDTLWSMTCFHYFYFEISWKLQFCWRKNKQCRLRLS